MLSLLFSRAGGYVAVVVAVVVALAYARYLQAGIAERDQTIDAHRTAIAASQRNAHAFEQALQSTQSALLARDRALADIQSRRTTSSRALRHTAEREDVRDWAVAVVPRAVSDVLRNDESAGGRTGAAVVPAGATATTAGAASLNARSVDP